MRFAVSLAVILHIGSAHAGLAETAKTDPARDPQGHVYQMAGCTESVRECSAVCAKYHTYSTLFAPETCYDWFHKGSFVCFCHIGQTADLSEF